MNMIVRITSNYIVPLKREYDPVAYIGFIFQPSLVFIFCEHLWIYKDSLSFLKNFLGSYSTNLRADVGSILCKGFLLMWSATAEYLMFPFWECFRCSIDIDILDDYIAIADHWKTFNSLKQSISIRNFT